MLSWWCLDSVEGLDSLPRRASDLFLLSIMTLSKWFPLSCCQAAALTMEIDWCVFIVCVLTLLHFLLISTNCSFILSRSLHFPFHTDPQYEATIETLLNWNVEGFWLDLLTDSFDDNIIITRPVTKRWLLCHNPILLVNYLQQPL